MSRFVIGPDVALTLAQRQAELTRQHKLLAPTLLRSQVLAQLFREVAAGRLSRAQAKSQLDYLRRLQIRLLGDRVLQDEAWKVAAELGWPDTFLAEYVALTKLQADALVLQDEGLATVLKGVVPTVTIEALLS